MRATFAIISVVAVTGLGLAAWAFYPATPQPTAPPSPEFPLHVSAEKLDLGEVWETESRNAELPVENRSGVAVDVSSWDQSCNCMAVEPAHLTVPAGETRTIRVRLNLIARGTPSPDEPGVRVVKARLTARSGNQAVGPAWDFSARVKSILTGLPREFNCGAVSDLAAVGPGGSFEIESTVPLGLAYAEVDPPVAQAQVAPVEDNAKRYRVTFRFARTTGPGEHRATLRLRTGNSSGTAYDPRHVQVYGETHTDVLATLSPVVLGLVPTGVPLSPHIDFRSTTGAEFEVRPGAVIPAGVTFAATDAGPSAGFRARIDPQAGAHKLSIPFTVRQPGREPYTVAVEVVYHGI